MTTGVEILVRMEMPPAMAERLTGLMPRFDPGLRDRVRQQLWLKSIFAERLRRTDVADRREFIACCDMILALLDPSDDVAVELPRALAWALYWIARHGIVPEPDGIAIDEWERWAEARRLVKAMGADQ